MKYGVRILAVGCLLARALASGQAWGDSLVPTKIDPYSRVPEQDRELVEKLVEIARRAPDYMTIDLSRDDVPSYRRKPEFYAQKISSVDSKSRGEIIILGGESFVPVQAYSSYRDSSPDDTKPQFTQKEFKKALAKLASKFDRPLIEVQKDGHVTYIVRPNELSSGFRSPSQMTVEDRSTGKTFFEVYDRKSSLLRTESPEQINDGLRLVHKRNGAGKLESTTVNWSEYFRFVVGKKGISIVDKDGRSISRKLSGIRFDPKTNTIHLGIKVPLKARRPMKDLTSPGLGKTTTKTKKGRKA